MQATRDKFLAAHQASSGGPLLVLRPQLPLLPLSIQRFDEPLLPFGKALIASTGDIVTGYIFDFAAYLSIGAAGAIALERTIGYVLASSAACAIVHGPFISDDYALAMGKTAFCADAVTVLDSTVTTAFHAQAILTLPVSHSGLPEQLAIPGTGLAIPVLGDAVVYQSRDDDFADVVRRAILESRSWQ